MSWSEEKYFSRRFDLYITSYRYKVLNISYKLKAIPWI